jgi:hypothetical protein
MSDPDAAPAEQVRVLVATTDRDGRARGPATSVGVPVGETVEIGREADLQIADDPEDRSVSRIAVSLRALDGGAMQLVVSNLNGVVVHPWGSRTRYLPAGDASHLIGGMTGIRVISSTSLDQPSAPVYWVLVEGNASAAPRIPVQRSSMTVQNTPPVPLTDAQRDAVSLIFAEHLAWPPLPAPQALTIDAAARRLGVSSAAVIQRLEGVRKKAYALGMAQQYGVVDPEYVFALVAHGYVEPPNQRVPAEELELFPG